MYTLVQCLGPFIHSVMYMYMHAGMYESSVHCEDTVFRTQAQKLITILTFARFSGTICMYIVDH